MLDPRHPHSRVRPIFSLKPTAALARIRELRLPWAKIHPSAFADYDLFYLKLYQWQLLNLTPLGRRLGVRLTDIQA